MLVFQPRLIHFLFNLPKKTLFFNGVSQALLICMRQIYCLISIKTPWDNCNRTKVTDNLLPLSYGKRTLVDIKR